MLIAGLQQVQTFHRALPSDRINSHYLLYLPRRYDAEPPQRWPLILFLHGGGERGHNLDIVKTQGLARVLEKQVDFPFIVVSPQCVANNWYSDVLDSVLEEVISVYRIDADRVYVTGMSMGGFGAWDLALTYPRRFAAIAPICGGGNPVRACDLAHLPVWAFHGARDTIVPLEFSRQMIEALQACGGDARLTIYPELEHDSWTPTYANIELYEWFLRNRRASLL